MAFQGVVMEDRSIIKPILDAIEYFNRSEKELQFFYKIIDRFCAIWFGHPILVSKFKKMELSLIHELLGEFIRFEENNKRIALWLFAVNRVCYNYSADLTAIKKEIEEMKKNIEETIDTSLIEQIIITLKKYEEDSLTSSVFKKGAEDSVGNFLQWIGVYTTYIYPSLENKSDFYDKNMIKAMNFLLYEFIQQKTNDKRLAYLIMAVMEACKQFSLQDKNLHPEFLSEYKNDNLVFAGTEEKMVEELLKKLKAENEKQRNKPVLSNDIMPDQFIKDMYDKLLDELNGDINESVTIFNKFTFDMASTFLGFEKDKQLLFLQALSRYRSISKESLNNNIYESLKNSVSLLSSRTKDWIKNELERLDVRKDLYNEYIIQKLSTEQTSTKINTAKLFIMLFLIKKLDLFS
jgi:hypothetical protein